MEIFCSKFYGINDQAINACDRDLKNMEGGNSRAVFFNFLFQEVDISSFTVREMRKV
jgi:hypothetical protein